MSQPLPPPRCRGFTTLELLVVIGIIVLLLSLLIPVVGRIRESARATDTQAWIQQLAGAIEQYHGDFRAYPGPLHNDEIRRGTPVVEFTVEPGYKTADANNNAGKITMAENLVLGLLGGLRFDAGNIQYNGALVGRGPMSLNPGNPKRYEPYVEPKNLSWQDIPDSGTRVKTGVFFDDVTVGGDPSNPVGADDSIIPEFVDRYPDPLPILYLRAKVGANPGGANPNQNPVITNGNPGYSPFRPGQYDITQIIGYTATLADGSSIGVGKKPSQLYHKNGQQVEAHRPYHGLNTITTTRVLGPAGDPFYDYPFDAFPYFRDPALSNPTNQSGVGYLPPHVARQKDRFILISAGPDRIYGTQDDITNFGPVVP